MIKAAALVFALGVPASAFLGVDPYARAAKDLTSDLGALASAKAAVAPFAYSDGRESSGGSIVASALEAELVRSGRLALVERAQLDKILSELKLQSTGAVSPESARQLGKLAGAELLITGTLSGWGRKAEVNAKLIRVETGEVLRASRVRVKKTWSDAPAAAAGFASGLVVSLSAQPPAGALRQIAGRSLAFRYADQGGRPVIRVTDMGGSPRQPFVEVPIRYNPRTNTYKQFRRDFRLNGRRYRVWSDLQSNLHAAPRKGVFGGVDESGEAVLELQPVFESWLRDIEAGMTELNRYPGPPETKSLAYFERMDERALRISIFTAADDGGAFTLDYEPREVVVLRGRSGRRTASRLMSDGRAYYRFHFGLDDGKVSVERVR